MMPNMKGWNIYELARRQYQERMERLNPTHYAAGSLEWQAEQKLKKRSVGG